MTIHPYLNFPGTCEEAFDFYAQSLDGKVAFKQTFADTPMADHVPADFKNKIVHARLEIDGQAILGSDASPDRFEKAAGSSVTINVNDPAQGEKIFNALSAGGQVEMPFGKTFWARGFGIFTDRYGIPWMINCE